MSKCRYVVLLAVAVVIAALVVVTAPGMLLRPSLDVGEAAPLGEAEVAVGEFTIRTRNAQHAGVAVYARAPLAAGALLDDLAEYRKNATDLTPAPLRQEVCSRSPTGCDNRTGEERLVEDVREAYGEAFQGPLGPPSPDLSLHLRGADSSFLLLFSGEFPQAADLPKQAVPKLDEVQAALDVACQEAAAHACDGLYRRVRVDANWSWALDRYFDAAPTDGTSVVGPLSWATQGYLSPDVRAPRVYVPWGLLAVAAALVAGCTLLHEMLERKFGNAFIPLQPLAVFAAIALILWVARNPGDPRILWRTGRVLLALLVPYYVLYRLLDFSGVQYFSTRSTLFILGGATLGFIVGLAQVIAQPVQTLVTLLHADGLAPLALRTTSYTLAGAGGVALAILIVSFLASLVAHREGKDLVPDEELDAYLATGRTRSGEAPSPEARASILARAWGKARRADKSYWLWDAMGLVPKDYEALDRKVDAMWGDYRAAAREARKPIRNALR